MSRTPEGLPQYTTQKQLREDLEQWIDVLEQRHEEVDDDSAFNIAVRLRILRAALESLQERKKADTRIQSRTVVENNAVAPHSAGPIQHLIHTDRSHYRQDVPPAAATTSRHSMPRPVPPERITVRADPSRPAISFSEFVRGTTGNDADSWIRNRWLGPA